MVYYILYAPTGAGIDPVYGSCLNVPQITGDEPFVRFLLIGIGFLLPTLVGLEGSIPSTYGGVEPSFLEKRLLAGHDDAPDQLVNLTLLIPMREGVLWGFSCLIPHRYQLPIFPIIILRREALTCNPTTPIIQVISSLDTTPPMIMAIINRHIKPIRITDVYSINFLFSMVHLLFLFRFLIVFLAGLARGGLWLIFW